MSRLHQIQLQFDPHQDRAVLRIRTTDKAEFLFWITRRFVQLLWNVLIKIVQTDELVSAQADPGNKQAVLAFQHEQAVQQSDFKTRYEPEVAQRPLGDTPMLLAKVQLRRTDGGDNILVLSPLQGKGIELRLEPPMVHSLCKLIAEICQTAQWNLPFTLQPGAPAKPAAQAPSKLN
jgi:hypothetical protein